MMRALVLLVSGVIVGAVLFHLFYLSQSASHRCVWDHPLNRQARENCVLNAAFKGYARHARRQLDELIDAVDH